MKQIIDKNGNKISGLYKKSDGSIVVVDADNFKKHITEKNRVDEILELKDRVNILESLIEKFLNNIK